MANIPEKYGYKIRLKDLVRTAIFIERFGFFKERGKMQKFIQYTPTEILFGENTQAEVGKEVKKWGGSRVFIVYGGGSVKKADFLRR